MPLDALGGKKLSLAGVGILQVMEKGRKTPNAIICISGICTCNGVSVPRPRPRPKVMTGNGTGLAASIPLVTTPTPGITTTGMFGFFDRRCKSNGFSCARDSCNSRGAMGSLVAVRNASSRMFGVRSVMGKDGTGISVNSPGLSNVSVLRVSVFSPNGSRKVNRFSFTLASFKKGNGSTNV